MLGINVRFSGTSSRVGDLAIKNAAGSKYMAGGVLNWAPAIPSERFVGDGRIRFKSAANNLRPALGVPSAAGQSLATPAAR